ncbi:MAG TPA: alpha/beta hydrolase [Actinomycetota bacterium]|nr:alpha/beta hydrolase [Actinomycetota bacterium]
MPAPASLDHIPEFVRSFDGTRIAVRRLGSGDRLPLLIANAVGANLAVWRRVLPALVGDRPAVTWDLRGLLESGEPASDRIDPGAHAEDAMAALDASGIDRVVLASWSNGSRIALEIAARYPERVARLAIVCGGYGHSPARLFTRLEPFSLLPTAAGVAKHFSSLFGGVLRSIAGRREISALIRHSGLVAASADVVALADLLRGFSSSDPKRLLATYEAVAGSHAPTLLRSIQSPTLVVAGSRDPLTTRAMAEETAQSIPGAGILIYDGATHYLPLEFPTRLAEDLGRFFATAG